MKKDLTPKVRFDGYKKDWKKEKLSRIVDVKMAWTTSIYSEVIFLYMVQAAIC